MHRFLGTGLLLIGMVGGWWLGRPPAPAAVDEVPADVAWRHYFREVNSPVVCAGDIGPHPIWVALALGASTMSLLTAVSPNPGRAWRIAFGLPA